MPLSTYIVRRGIEAAHHGMLAATSEPEQPGDGKVTPISPFAALIFLLSGLVFMFLLFSVCGLVYATERSH